MEFLIRIKDKTNAQVFCYNPIHKGNHMDRVFFEDSTFTAACPECLSSEYLYRKNNAISKKGHFITFKPDGWSWGKNELKHFGIVKIDCTEEEAQTWCETIEDEEAKADVVKFVNDKEKLILAENRVQIAHRYRKLAFDFEKVLTSNQLKDWNDIGKDSEIVIISEQDKVQIKEG